jgi:dolichol kinase
MALLLCISVACFFMILNAVNGRASRVDQFVHHIDYEITDYGEKADRGSFYMYILTISYYYMFLPFVIVIYWGVLLIYDSW